MKVHSTAIAVILSSHGTVVFGSDSSNVRGATELKDEPEKQLIHIESPMKDDSISNNEPTGDGREDADLKSAPGNEANPLSKEDPVKVMYRLPRNSVLKGMSAEMRVLKKRNNELEKRNEKLEKSNWALKESVDALKTEVAVAFTNELQPFGLSESSGSVCTKENRSDLGTVSFGMDLWVHGTANENTSSRVSARFYEKGKDIGCVTKDGVGNNSRWMDDDNFSLQTIKNASGETPADRVELTIYGSDAMLIEHAYLGVGLIAGKSKTWGGDDNGQGWCLSTDPNDYKGGWESHVPAKVCFYKLQFHENGKVYGWKAGSTSEEWLSLN